MVEVIAGRALLLGACIALSGCVVPAMAVIGGLATVADTTKHWNDECRMPPGKQAIERAREVMK